MSRALASGRTLATGRTAAGVRIGDLGITKALYLGTGGTARYVDFGAQTFLDGTPFTFCIRNWITNSSMTDDSNTWSYGFSSASDRGYCMRPNASTRKWQLFFGNGNVQTTSYTAVGKHYLFVEFDGTSTLRIYRNTVLQDTLSITPKVAGNGLSTYLGARDTNGRFFTGVLGDGAIYNRVLTAAEKLSIVTRAQYPTSGAQIIVRMDDEGSTINDYSGNNRDGTLTIGNGFWRNSPFNA